MLRKEICSVYVVDVVMISSRPIGANVCWICLRMRREIKGK